MTSCWSHPLWKARPWVVDGQFNKELYCYHMTQFVLDRVEIFDGHAQVDPTTRAWVGSSHVQYAAGVLGVPINVPFDQVYQPKEYPWPQRQTASA